MTWKDRLQAAAYTSPSGERIEWQYENVSASFEKKTTAFEFADADGTFVQDLGRTGRRLPMRCIFSGDDYDQEAARFDRMLGEAGAGTLEHPAYGTFTVVPAGTIARRDDLKTRANQAVFDVTFFETNDLLYPSNSFSPGSDVLQAVADANTANPEAFVENVTTETTIEEVGLRDRLQGVVGFVGRGLEDIASRQADVKQRFDAITQSLNLAAQTLISDPFAVAFQASLLIQLPALVATSLVDRLSAYAGLLDLLTTNGTVYTPGNDSQPQNAFEVDSLAASSIVLGAILAVVDNEFKIKTEAIDAAEAVMALCDRYVEWRDANQQSLGTVDTGEVYQQLSEACAIGAGFLVEISFTLLPERSIVLDRPRAPLELEAQLYGTLDSNLDFLITSNDLVGEELFEIPAGRTVVYYA